MWVIIVIIIILSTIKSYLCQKRSDNIILIGGFFPPKTWITLLYHRQIHHLRINPYNIHFGSHDPRARKWWWKVTSPSRSDSQAALTIAANVSRDSHTACRTTWYMSQLWSNFLMLFAMLSNSDFDDGRLGSQCNNWSQNVWIKQTNTARVSLVSKDMASFSPAPIWRIIVIKMSKIMMMVAN